MPPTFTANDSEFATATGANANTSGGTSTFDHPPDGYSDLVIAAQEGDSSPYQFDVGDTYDISFSGANGPVFLQNAKVVRSDYIDSSHDDSEHDEAEHGGSQGGAVVFEGTDENGEVVQVVWTPGFDLDQWYWDNHSEGRAQGFNASDQEEANYGYVCFGFGTRIEAEGGAVPVERLIAGQRVRTRDSGLQKVIWVGKSLVPGRADAAPVRFAPGALGALGNDAPLMLSQQHRVMISHPLAELYFGSAEVFVPARALAGLPGIGILTTGEIGYAHLLLPRHEVILAEGVACESLFFGDVAQARIGSAARREIASIFPGIAGALPAGTQASQAHRLARPALRMFEARLLASMIWEVDLPALPRATSPGLFAA